MTRTRYAKLLRKESFGRLSNAVFQSRRGTQRWRKFSFLQQMKNFYMTARRFLADN
jgi:hypothetical protein